MIEKQLYDQLCADVLPFFRRIAMGGRYAITLGGSHGKGLSDRRSDFDFRLYFDVPGESIDWQTLMTEMDGYMKKWRALDVEIDGVWPRSIQDVDRQLDEWLAGKATPQLCVWNVWGYQMLTDIYNQAIVEDPQGVAQAWKDRLSIYPDTLRDALIEKHGGSLRYWRQDYHYANKVLRRDYTFTAYITARLVHDMMQVVYAVNRFYYPGDGLNLIFLDKLPVKPEGMKDRAVSLLYPGNSADCLDWQYRETIALMDDILDLLRKT